MCLLICSFYTWRLVNVVEAKRELVLCVQEPCSVEQLNGGLWIHRGVLHGIDIGPAVEFTGKLGWKTGCHVRL